MGARGALIRVLTTVVGAGIGLGETPLTAQEITYADDLPRTLVFVREEGRAQVASREITTFFRAAGLPMIDPALAHEAAQRELVQAALDGDAGAATALGRDFGAQLLVLGSADWGSRPDPVDGSLVVVTTEVSVRALRLDFGEVVSTASADARAVEATEQAGRTTAIRRAAREVLTGMTFVGHLVNDWEERPWQETTYWRPDPGSVPASAKSTAGAELTDDRPGLAILRADVLPAEGVATRGIGVVRKGGGDLSPLRNTARLEGVVVGSTRSVRVDGQPALLEPIDAGEATLLGIGGLQAQRFTRSFDLPVSRDSVRIVATGPSGGVTEAVAAPRIDRRWAVVIGIGQYASEEIPDLAYSRADAEAVYRFLTSAEAGPFDDVLLLVDEEATGAPMRRALFVFLQQADWDDLVVIYYAGHGAPDPHRPQNLYLFPTDSDVHSLASTGFPMWDVKVALRRHIAAERVVVFADACHSAGTADGDVVGGAGSNGIAATFAQLFEPSRRLTMTAANTDEFSFEDARWGGHGVFTYYMLEGLAGRADLNDDGIVTFTELFDFISQSVRLDTEGRQNPQRAGFGDVPLAVVEGRHLP